MVVGGLHAVVEDRGGARRKAGCKFTDKRTKKFYVRDKWVVGEPTIL